MRPEKNSSKGKTEPSGKGKLGKSLEDGRNWGKKARKENNSRIWLPVGWKTSLEGQVPQEPKSHYCLTVNMYASQHIQTIP